MEKEIQARVTSGPDTLYARGVVLVDPATGNPYAASGGGGGGGTGGAVTIADGANATQGAIADAAITADAAGTLSGKLRGLVKILASVWDSVNGRLKVDGSAVTQPISAASLPLPAGAATAAAQATINLALGAPADSRAAWYDSAANSIQLLKLAIAAFVGAGSRTYAYTSGQLTSEAWTLFGTTRTKTYTYTGGVLTGESDWV